MGFFNNHIGDDIWKKVVNKIGTIKSPFISGLPRGFIFGICSFYNESSKIILEPLNEWQMGISNTYLNFITMRISMVMTDTKKTFSIQYASKVCVFFIHALIYHIGIVMSIPKRPSVTTKPEMAVGPSGSKRGGSLRLEQDIVSSAVKAVAVA